MTLLDNPLEFERVFYHLRRASIFRNTSRFDLARLVAMASTTSVAPGDTICVADNAPGAPSSPSFYLLLSGDFTLNGSALPSGIQSAIAGLEDVLRGTPRSISLTALSSGTVVEIPASATRGLLGTSSAFRQSLHPLLGLAPAPTPCILPSELGSTGNVVQFVTTIVDTPMSLLIELLAREIATRFSDTVLVLRACSPGQAPSPSPIQVPGSGLGALFYMYVDPIGNPGISATFSPQFDYVFLDGVTSSVVDIVVKMFFGHPQEYLTTPSIGSPRILQTSVVGQPPLPCSDELQFVNANAIKSTHGSHCRIRLDLVQVRALAQAWNPYMPLAMLDEGLTREMGVWARALTQRRTGLALAGGGVWSMQSVFIIRELCKRGVPLDVITGASAGAMIGGYYSVLGLPGLDLIVERGDSGVLDVVVALWMLIPGIAEAFFGYEFGGHACLENLDVDFRPNSTNLSIGEGVAFTRGPVATAVRAAASAPPLVAPTFSASQRFVDGAFSNNVAAQVLPYFGANLTFAANTYPPSFRPKPAWVPDFVTRLTSLGPLNRLFDFTVALNILANLTGKIEGGFADVAYNAAATIPFPFFLTTQFRLSSQIVAEASQNPDVLAAIDEFTARWEHSRRRGGRTWTTTPS